MFNYPLTDFVLHETSYIQSILCSLYFGKFLYTMLCIVLTIYIARKLFMFAKDIHCKINDTNSRIKNLENLLYSKSEITSCHCHCEQCNDYKECSCDDTEECKDCKECSCDDTEECKDCKECSCDDTEECKDE